MTLGIELIRKDQCFNIGFKLDMSSVEILKKLRHVQKIYKQFGKTHSVYNGKTIASFTLPDDFCYERKNGADPNEPIVKIYRGVLLEGTLDKALLGQSYNSLIVILNKEYGPDVTCNFIDGIQFAATEWLLIRGFSIGLKDCMIPRSHGKEREQEIQDTIQKFFIEAEGIKTTTSHAGIRERRINAALNKAKDVGLRIAKESLAEDNSFL